MILLLAWLLVVCVVYFRQSDSLFEYVSFLYQHHGSFSLWHPYALKAVVGFVVAAWIAWVGVRCGEFVLGKIVPDVSLTRLEKRVFSAALGFGIVGLVTFALGVVHLWYAPVFWSLLILATGVVLVRNSPRRGGVARSAGVVSSAETFRRTSIEASPYRARASRHPVGACPPFTLPLLFLTGAIFLIGDLSPEVFYDSLHYHLAVPNLYLIAHRIYDPPNLAYSSLVMTADHVWGFALTVGNELTAKVLHGATALLLLAAFIAFERRYLTPGAGLLGALFFLSTPMVGMNVATAGIDVAASALQFVAVFALIRALEEPEKPQWLLLAGTLTGIAASCKYTYLPAIPIACILIIWHRRRFARFAISATLMVLPFFARNLVYHHNPVYPFFATSLGVPRLTAQNWQNISNETQPRRLEDVSTAGSVVRLALHPWFITMKGRTSSDFIGPIFLGLLPLALFAHAPSRAFGILARYCLGLWIVWLLTTSMPRFAMPLIAMLSLILAHASLSATAGASRRAVVFISFLVVVTNLYFTLFFNANSENWRVLFGQVRESVYLAQAHPTYPAPGYEAIEWMNEHLPAGSKVLVAGDSRTMYTRVPAVPSSVFDAQVIVETARMARDGDEMARLLRGQGITHIFINFAEAVRTDSYGLFRFDPQTWAVLENFWSRYPELMFVRYQPDPANLKGLFVFKIRSDEETRRATVPATNPFVRWKPN